MPNYCFFDMCAVGKPDQLDEFAKDIVDYERPRHMWRVFECDEYERADVGNSTQRRYYSGYCAWSVSSCMTDDSPFAYARSAPDKSITLEQESAERGLTIEIFSNESGCCFAEHYKYEDGQCTCNETVDYEEYWWDRDEHPTFEEFKREYNLPDDLKEDDGEDDTYIIGGFDGQFTI